MNRMMCYEDNCWMERVTWDKCGWPSGVSCVAMCFVSSAFPKILAGILQAGRPADREEGR